MNNNLPSKNIKELYKPPWHTSKYPNRGMQKLRCPARQWLGLQPVTCLARKTFHPASFRAAS